VTIHIFCVLPDWNHWNLPMVSTSSVGALAWCNIPGHCILPGAEVVGLSTCAGFFLNHIIIIYADSHSHKKYTILYFPSIPGEGHVVYIGVIRPFRIFVEGLRAPDYIDILCT
jgi:hypothetical protein